MNARTWLRRMLAAVLALWGASLISFLLGVIAPGDPALEALRQGPYDQPSPEAVATLRHEWGLDQPLAVRYVNWMSRVLSGDLGVSYFSRRAVTEELWSRLPATLVLAMAATLLASIVGVGAGVICAWSAGSWIDAALRFGSITVASLPSFVIGIGIILVCAERLHLLPTSGYGTPAHLVLPAVALSVGEAARLLRLTRTELIDTLACDYIRTARAKGLRRRAIALRHALPNALLDVTTAIGLHLGAILGGAAVIEVIFAWPGIGRLAVDAISRRDYPVIQGYVLLSGAAFVGVNLVVDLLYGTLDPRVRT